jgi:hypothetical protein
MRRRSTPFHRIGIEHGGIDNGAPGPRAYGPYAAYILDPDGNDVEAAFRAMAAPG